MNRGFTLVELLVVITIIVVLLALLTPALDKAVEQAQRAVCASRLHAFGLGVTQYSLDQKRKVPITVTAYGGPYPSLVRNLHAQGPGQWSGELMGPYIGGVELDTGIYGPQWYCPSNGKTSMKDQGNQATSVGLIPSLGGNYGWLAVDYAYFARIPPEHATFPDDLVGKEGLGGGKLLMADTIYYWQGGNHDNWWFNHHVDGPSVHAPDWGAPNMRGEAIRGITGTNQLFGDSSVVWKDGGRFKPDLMLQRSWETTWVGPGKGSPGQPQQNADLNFY